MTDEVKHLVESLREHAKWAMENVQDHPLTMAYDLTRAADLIENLTLDRDKWKRQAEYLESADREKDALFYENARLRSR